MVSHTSQSSVSTQKVALRQDQLTRRSSKLIVEMVIGIIGLLGIALAQVKTNQLSHENVLANRAEQTVGKAVSQISTEFSWKDLLF